MTPIVINWIVYGVIIHCESIGTTFGILTFAVNPFWRHLMMTSAIYTICHYTVLYNIMVEHHNYMIWNSIISNKNVTHETDIVHLFEHIFEWAHII